jgi:histidinol dehydrogenase
MLRTIDLRGTADVVAALPARSAPGAGPVSAVEAILADVRTHGDAALRRLTHRFDGVDRVSARIDMSECHAALARLQPGLRVALEMAHESIVRYHRTQLHPPVDLLDGGVRLRSYALPVDRAGCYVPGGAAPLASTVLMTASIAGVAGVPEVVLVTPPDRELGRPVDAVLAAAAIAGVHEVYAVGGAQAIGALAYGTATIRPVDVIVGPGNVYVSLAKRIVAGEGCVGVPSSFAGPSEVVVMADRSTPPRFAAIDVVLQAEHGPDGAAWLVTWDKEVAAKIVAEIAIITRASPRRRDLEANFAARGFVVLVDDPVQAAAVVNALAPEHLELLIADPEAGAAIGR